MKSRESLSAFVAYPGNLPEVSSAVASAIEILSRQNRDIKLRPWTANDIAGRCLLDPILENISKLDVLIADITNLNFNVVYEIGFAIAVSKRVILINNSSIQSEEALRSQVGIFDTLGYETYTDGDSLSKVIARITDTRPLTIPTKINRQAPVFVVSPRDKSEVEVRLISRIKKVARLHFRTYDPQESPRMSVRDAIAFVSESLAVVVPLIPSRRREHRTHNLRCAFVAGLAHGLGKETLLLQEGDDPVPLDLRDFVSSYKVPSDIDQYVARLAPRITEKLQEETQTEFPEFRNPLQDIHIGESAAENEFLELANYYVPLAAYDRVLTGAIQVVTGRKGSGKSALFFRLRDQIRKNTQNVVIDLNPEGFQLRKFKTIVLDQLESGTKEHTVTAFWEYLLLLEVCYKLLEKDRQKHKFNHLIRDTYLQLQELYINDKYISEGDFAERLLCLTSGIEENFEKIGGAKSGFLSREKVTELIYCHDLHLLKEKVYEYLSHKGELWILFDNLDKGWSAHGVGESDLLTARCLIEALRKITRELAKEKISSRGVVFLRNDIFELMIGDSPDRGKVARVSLDWNDEALLKELIRRRFLSAPKFSNKDISFETIWNAVVTSHFSNGEETSSYMIGRSLMRPRCLLEFLIQCKGHALNLGHDRINDEDILWAENVYSTDLVRNIELEIQDVFDVPDGCLYSFIETSSLLDLPQLQVKAGMIVPEEKVDRFIDLLIWYGFIGILRSSGEMTFIYDTNYEMSKIKALISARPPSELVFVINPAFRKGLDISE